MCAAVVDLDLGIIVGFDRDSADWEEQAEPMCTAAMALFATPLYKQIESSLTVEDAPSKSLRTLEACIQRGDYHYLGRPLTDQLAVLVVVAASSSAGLHMAQLKASLSNARRELGLP